jgi:YD repeat-containing protein
MKSVNLLVRTFLSVILLGTLLLRPSPSNAGCDGCGGSGTPSREKKVQVEYWYGLTGYLNYYMSVHITKTYKGQTTVLVDIVNMEVNGDSGNLAAYTSKLECEPGSILEGTISGSPAPHSPEGLVPTVGIGFSAACFGSSAQIHEWNASASLTIGQPEGKDGSFGSCKATNGSVQLSFGLGDTPGTPVGTIWLEETDLVLASYTPAVLQYEPEGSAIRILQGGQLKQVLSPDGLAHVETISASSFELRFFEQSKVGPISGGIYTVTGGTGIANSAVTWRISDPGPLISGEPRFKVEEIRGGVVVGSKVWTQVSGGGDWDLEVGNGDRIERKRRVDGSGAGNYTLTKSVSMKRNGIDILVSEREEVFSNDLLTSLRLGPAVGGILTTYAYDASGKRTSMQSSDGLWEKYGTTVLEPDPVPNEYTVGPFSDLNFASGNYTTGRVGWRRFGSSGDYWRTAVNDIKINSGHTKLSQQLVTGVLGDTADYSVLVTETAVDGEGSSYSHTFQPDAPNGMGGWPWWESDLQGHAREYNYRNGTVDAQGNFTENFTGTFRRQILTEKEQYGQSIPGKSIRTVTIYDAGGNAVVEEHHECTALDAFTMFPARCTRTLHSGAAR